MNGLNNYTDHFNEFLSVITEPGDRTTLELVRYYFKSNPGDIEKYTELTEAFLAFFVQIREHTQPGNHSRK